MSGVALQASTKNPSDWLQAQPDIIHCEKLSCRMKLEKCHDRQKNNYRYVRYYDGVDILYAISPMFASCQKCKHFLPEKQVPLLAPPNLDELIIIFQETA